MNFNLNKGLFLRIIFFISCLDNTCRRPGDLEALLDLSRLSLGDLEREADRALLASGSPPSLDLDRSLLFLSSSPERERVRPRSRDLERSPPRSPRPLERERDFDRLRSRLGLQDRRSGHYLYSICPFNHGSTQKCFCFYTIKVCVSFGSVCFSLYVVVSLFGSKSL